MTQLDLAKAGGDYQTLAVILNDNPTLTWRGWWSGYDARTQPPGAFQRFGRETLSIGTQKGPPIGIQKGPPSLRLTRAMGVSLFG